MSTSQATAIDISTFFAGGIHATGQDDRLISYGNLIYNEVWYKFLLPANYESYNVTVWNLGGNPYATYPPPDDELVPYYPGDQFPCFVTVYDASNNVITHGKHVQFTNFGRTSTWVYFKVEQPAPHYSQPLYCYSRFKIGRMGRCFLLPGHIIVQGASSKLITAQPVWGESPGTSHNIILPERTGHSLAGKCGDILLTGINCIEDAAASGFSIRSKYYLAAVTFSFAPGTIINSITGNADRINDFWVSYTESGVNKCRAVKILAPGNQPYLPVTAELGPVIGITGKVKVLRALMGEVLYYVLEGENIVRRWNIRDNVELPIFYGDPGYGNITDILIVPGSDVLIGYNNQLTPTTYTIRRFTGLDINVINHVADYSFTSNGLYNRMNYTENNGVICIWTHEVIGKSTFRRMRLADGVVDTTITTYEFEGDRLVLDNNMYVNIETNPFAFYPKYVPSDPPQYNGAASAYNFWIQPVYVFDNQNSTAGEGILPTSQANQPPPDDEWYGVYFPPYLPWEMPSEPEVPPYPGYPWLPPPPPLPNDPPLHPPLAVPLPVTIGGGLILLDPRNPSRTDSYHGVEEGKTINVPIKVNIRTAFIGD